MKNYQRSLEPSLGLLISLSNAHCNHILGNFSIWTSEKWTPWAYSLGSIIRNRARLTLAWAGPKANTRPLPAK